MSVDAIGLAKDFSIFDPSVLSEEDRANNRRFPTPKEFVDSASMGGGDINLDELGKAYVRHYKDYATKSVGMSPALADAKALAVQNMFFNGKDANQFNDAWSGVLNPQEAQAKVQEQDKAAQGDAGHLDNIQRGYYQQSAANYLSSAMDDMVQAEAATRVRAGQDWLSNRAATNNKAMVMGGGGQPTDITNQISSPLPPDPYGVVAQTNEQSAITNVQQAQTQLDKANALPTSKGIEEFSKTQGFFDAAGNLISNPFDTAIPLIEQSLAPMALQLGTAAGGALVAGIPGAMMAGGAASYDVNRASKILEESQKTGKPLIDIVRDMQLRGEIQGEASRYAAVVGAADAVSMGLAGATMPARTLLGRAAQQTGLQMALGAGGEAGGQLAQSGEITSGREIAAEGVLEGFFGVGEVGIARFTQGNKAQPATNRDTPLNTTTITPEPVQAGVNPLTQFVPPTVTPTQAPANQQATNQVVRGKSIGDLIASGEGDYQSFNRGVAGDSVGEKIDFSQMTVAEVMQRQALPKGNPNRIFTVGKYQAIPDTFAEAVQKLGIPADAKVTPALQEYIFSEYLLKDKRPDIRDYITGKTDNLKAAQKAGALEWASVADPDTGLSAYGNVGNNKASIAADTFGRSLESVRKAYADAIAQGASPDEAWSRSVGTQSSLTTSPIRTSQGFQRTTIEPTVNQSDEAQSSTLSTSTSPITPPTEPMIKQLPTAEIYDAQNNKYNAQYEVVDASTISPAIDKADNQYRDRNRAESQRQIENIASDPNYGRLNMLHSTFTDGAPVLQQDSTIIAGNGRIAGLKKAYESGNADNYKRGLISDLSSKGIDVAPIEQMQSPILVRRLTDNVDTKKVSVLSNVGSGMSMSPSEQAIIDAEYIQSLHDFTPDDTGEISFQSASGLFKRLAKAVPANERNSILTDDNKVGADGVRRVKNALLYMAYGDSPALRQMTESGTPEHINVTKALVKAAPILAELKDNIRQGISQDADITPAIVDSFALFSQIKRDQNNTIESWLNQQDVFSQVKPEVKILIKRLDEATRRPNQLSEFLVNYANKLKTYGSPKQMGLLGANVAPSQLEVLNRAEADRNNVTTGGSTGGQREPRVSESTAQLGTENRPESNVNEASGRGSTGSGVVEGQTLYNISPRPLNFTGNDTPLTTAWRLIAAQDDAFQLPISGKKTLSAIATDYDPAIKVELGPENKNQRQWVIRFPNGKSFQEATVTEGKGRDKTIYLDISQFKTGSGGRTVYQMVGDYAHNTGKVFIGDPNGLSAIAQIRRTENMLSSALRWGTTDHLQPHELQLKPDNPNATPLQWKIGNTEFNIDQMLRASMSNLLNQIPELGQIRYNFESQQFEKVAPDGTVRPFGETAFRELAKSRGARAAEAGRTTLKRAVVSASVLSGQGQAAWNAILGNLIRQSNQQLGSLTGILYGLNLSFDQTIQQVATDKKLSTLAEDALLSVFGSSPKNQSIATRLLRQFFFDNFVPSDTYPDSRSFVTAQMNELRSSGALQAINDTYFSGNAAFKLKDDANRKPISADKAEAAIRRILGDIPFETRIPAEIKAGAGEAANRVKGAFANGKIYIDTRNIGSIAEAEALAVEELTHRGVANLFGDEYESRLNALYEAIGGEAGIRRFTEQHKIEMADDYFKQSPTTQIDELLAHIEANQNTLTVRVKRAFQRIIAHLRNAIRALNTRVLHNVSDSDIILIARNARNAAKESVNNPMANPRFGIRPEQESAEINERLRIRDEFNARPKLNSSNRVRQFIYSNKQSLLDKKASVQDRLFKKEGDWRAAVNDWKKRYFYSDSTLGRDIADARRGIDWSRAATHDAVISDVVLLEALTQNIYGKPRSELSLAEQEQFHRVLTGQETFANDSYQADVQYFRERIDKASQELINEKYREMQMRINELNNEGKATLNGIAADLLAGKDDILVPTSLAQIAKLQRQINTIESNQGTYLHRSYQAFTDPRWAKKVRRQPVFQEAIKFIKDDRLASTGRELTDAQAEGVLNQWLERAADSSSMLEFSSGQGTNEGILKQRKDIPPILRELLGEFKDPVYNYANTITQIADYVAKQRYQMTLRQLLLSMPDIAFIGKAPEGMKVATFPESTAYSALHDLYVDVDFMRDLKEFGALEDIQNPLMRWTVQLSSAVKLGKTVLSPTTAMRNFWSGFMLLAAAGHSPFGGMADAYSVIRNAKNRMGFLSGDLILNDKEAAQLNQKYIRLGIRRDGAHSGELAGIFRDFHQADTAVKEQGLARKAFNGALAFYQFGDDFFKIIHFEKGYSDLLEAGLSPEQAEQEAARRTRDTMPTYSMVPKALQQLRRFPLIGTFVSFPWEVMRTLKNSLDLIRHDYQMAKQTGNNKWAAMANKRVIGLTIAYAVPTLTAMLSRSLSDIEDDDNEAIDHFSSDWRKGQLRLFLGGDAKNPIYLDMTSLIPSEYIIKSLRIGVQKGSNEGIWSGLFNTSAALGKPFYSFDMTTKGIYNLFTNQDDNGNAIYGDGKSITDLLANPVDNSQHLGEALGYLSKQFGPGVIQNINDFNRALSGSVADAESAGFFGRFINERAAAIGGKVSHSGKEFNLADAVAALVGFRMTNQNMVVLGQQAARQTRDKTASYSAEFKRAVDVTTPLSNEFLDSRLEQVMADRARAFGKMIDLTQYYRNKKIPDAEIVDILYDTESENHPFSKETVAKLIKGEIPKFTVSKEIMSGSLRAADKIEDPRSRMQAKRALAERYRYLSQRAAAQQQRSTAP